MSKIDTMLEINSNNQDLFVDLNQKDTETISGGGIFTLQNNTNHRIKYTIDGTTSNFHEPGESWAWSFSSGKLTYDEDFRTGEERYKTTYVSDGALYEFVYDDFSNGDPFDITLQRIFS